MAGGGETSGGLGRDKRDLLLRGGRGSRHGGGVIRVFPRGGHFVATCAVVLAVGCGAFAQEALAPSNAGDLLREAVKDFEKKDYDAAEKKLDELNRAAPGSPFVLNLLGALWTKKKDYAKARESFEAALKADAGFFPAQFNIGELMFLEERYPAALEYFASMLSQNPGNELLQFKVFLCQLMIGNTEQAQKALEGIRFPGETPAWYYARAAWDFKRGEDGRARESLRVAREFFKDTALFDESLSDLGFRVK